MFKFVSNNCLYYLSEIFEFAPHCMIGTRNSCARLTWGRKTYRELVPLYGTISQNPWNSKFKVFIKTNVKKHLSKETNTAVTLTVIFN